MSQDLSRLSDDELAVLLSVLGEQTQELTSLISQVRAEQAHRIHIAGQQERGVGVSTFGDAAFTKAMEVLPQRVEELHKSREAQSSAVEDVMSWIDDAPTAVREQVRSVLEEAPWPYPEGFVHRIVSPYLSEARQIVIFGPDDDPSSARLRLTEMLSSSSLGNRARSDVEAALKRLDETSATAGDQVNGR